MTKNTDTESILDPKSSGLNRVVGLFKVRSDEALTVVWANDKFYEIYGYASSEEMRIDVNMSIAACIVPSYLNTLRDLINKALTAGQNSVEMDACIINKKIGIRWALMWGVFVKEDGVSVMYGCIMDNTDRKRVEQDLQIEKRKYNLLKARSKISVLEYDYASKILTNSNASTQHGYQNVMTNIPQSIIDKGLVSEKEAEKFTRMKQRLLSGEKEVSDVFYLLSGNKQDSWYEKVTFINFYDEFGVPCRATGFAEDVTAQVEVGRHYRQEKERYENKSEDLIARAIINLNLGKIEKSDVIDSVNYGTLKLPTLGTLFKRSASQVYEDDEIRKFFSHLTVSSLIEYYHNGQQRFEFEYMRRLQNTTAKPLWIRYSIIMVLNPENNNIYAFMYMNDINDIKTQQLLLKYRSERDQLTTLYNKSTFGEKVKRELKEFPYNMHALLLVDLDDFKAVNDHFGHLAGDNVLIEISKELKAIVKEADLVGRIGGDEFMLFLKNIPSLDALNKRAKTICKMLQVEVADSMKISASLGIAIYPVDGTKYEELYNNADIAAYHAKAKGKNSFSMYNAGMNMYDTCCMSLLSPIDERDSEKEVDDANSIQVQQLLYENEQLERKQNELEHYSRIFDNKNLAYIQWDAKRDEFFMSVTAHKYVLSTLTPQQLFVDNFDTNTIHPSDRKKFLRTFYSKIQKKKSSANCNFRLLLADGGYEMCSVTEIMILDERGEIDKALGIFVQSD